MKIASVCLLFAFSEVFAGYTYKIDQKLSIPDQCDAVNSKKNAKKKCQKYGRNDGESFKAFKKRGAPCKWAGKKCKAVNTEPKPCKKLKKKACKKNKARCLLEKKPYACVDKPTPTEAPTTPAPTTPAPTTPAPTTPAPTTPAPTTNAGTYCDVESAKELAKSLGYKTGGKADGCGFDFVGKYPNYYYGLYAMVPDYKITPYMANCAYFGEGNDHTAGWMTDDIMNAFISEHALRPGTWTECPTSPPTPAPTTPAPTTPAPTTVLTEEDYAQILADVDAGTKSYHNLNRMLTLEDAKAACIEEGGVLGWVENYSQWSKFCSSGIGQYPQFNVNSYHNGSWFSPTGKIYNYYKPPHTKTYTSYYYQGADMRPAYRPQLDHWTYHTLDRQLNTCCIW